MTVARQGCRRSTAWARASSCLGRLRDRHGVLRTAFGGQAQWRASRVRGHCGGRASTRSSPAAFPRASERVQACHGEVRRRLAVSVRAEVKRGRGARHALARPEGVPCALWRGMGQSWARLGARVPTRVSLVSVKGGHELVQGGEREPVGMVVQSRSEG